MQIQEFVQPIMFHTNLNPKLWEKDQLRADVQVKLLSVAKNFLESLKLDDIPLVDIIITGSNTALTYTPQSDLDLHIIVNMEQIYNGSLVNEFFDAKKRLWNNLYDVELYGVPIEIYVEDDDETVRGNKFSLMSNTWLHREPITKTGFDDRSVRAKVGYLKRQIERELDRADNVQDLTDLLDKLRKYRQAGLDKHGEFSTENLAFKSLRNEGLIQKIHDRRIELTNKTLSLD